MLADDLKEIIRLTDDHTYSHAARMVEIKKLAVRALEGAGKNPSTKSGKLGDGAKTRDHVQEQNPSTAGTVTF